MRLRELLNEITERLRGDLPELAASLNPPATEIELRQAEEELGFSLPAELRELYLIHNGESEDGPGLFFRPSVPVLGLHVDGMANMGGAGGGICMGRGALLRACRLD